METASVRMLMECTHQMFAVLCKKINFDVREVAM